MSDEQHPKEKAIAPTYQEVKAIAKQLVDSGRLTPAWISEQLDHKPAKEFKDSELNTLKGKLERFQADWEENNAAQ